ncbi:MAG: T9SS type A sorting domain-containing protein [Bacteroidia bacterium]
MKNSAAKFFFKISTSSGVFSKLYLYILLIASSLTGADRLHAQSITTGVVPSTINTGAIFAVPVTITGGYLNFTSVFTVYLSDASGSFATKTSIGTVTYFASVPVSINAIIPCATLSGNLYRIRVECNNPLVVGSDNGSNITIISGAQIITGIVASPFCQGATVSVPFTVTCGPLSNGNIFNAELSDAGGNFPGITIGTVASTSSGIIVAVIPLATAPGSLYRIRVKSSIPSITGSLNSNGLLTLNPITITTGTVAASFCQGTAINVPYTVCGGFIAGNVFSAELSNATGAFPGTVIGSLASTSSGSIIVTVPLATTPGGSYRIRVRSSSPAVTGSLNANGSLALNAISITTGAVITSFCQGAAISVPYTVCGGFIPGNIFTAQLSDITGSFGSPVNIGSITSVNSGTISATIPLGISPTGTGYRIRVISSTPLVTGAINSNGILTLNPISITTGAVAAGTCQASSITVPYTICGGYTTGNIFTAELSDVNGNFPGTIIGTLTSTTNGTINAALPMNSTPGSLYRIRVKSSLPSLTGTDNGSNIKISAKTTLSQYTYLHSGNAYAPLTGNTDVPVATGNLNEGMSAPVNIGFTFNFGGLNFTQLKMSTNGWITFNSASIATSVYNVIASSETFAIAGFAANLNLGGIKPMSYKLTGTAPYRILKLQWHGITHVPMSPGSGSLTAGEFQIWLYETTNVFDINFGTFTTTAVANFGSYAQVGWKGECPTDGDALYKSSYPYWDTPWNGYGYVTSLSFGSSGGFLFLPIPGELFKYTPPFGSPLPVQLISFEGLIKNNEVILEWATASELNNDYFLVEKHINDGPNEWKEIGQIKSKGNSNQVQNYSLTDEYPANGINYYRLKQVDFNEEFTYSQIIYVNVKQNQKQDINIYPNPAADEFTISGFNFNTGDQIMITNSIGKVIYQKTMSEITNTIKIEIKAFEHGIYFVKIISASKIETLKLIKN